MIVTNNLTFQYTNQQTFRFPNIVLKENENLLILGTSGIGKTTLLHLLAGLLPPLTGKIEIDTIAINELSQSKLDQFRGKHIGMVFQNNHAVRSLTVLDNLKARLLFSKKKINTNAIENLLDQLGLSQHKNSTLNNLSVGQLQRLGIALAVIHQPKIILADEPTSSLDDGNCNIVIELLLEQAKQTNANLIVITHDHRIQPYFKNSITL